MAVKHSSLENLENKVVCYFSRQSDILKQGMEVVELKINDFF